MHKALYFVAGAAAGSLITFLAVKKHYQKKTEDTIAAIREFHASKEEAEKELEEEQKEKYTELVTTLEYAPEHEEVPVILHENRPTIEKISEEDYGNDAGYEAIPTYIYYANGILVDELGDEVPQSSIEKYLGSDFYLKFENDDVLYLRNHESKCDFEIIMDESDYESTFAQG